MKMTALLLQELRTPLKTLTDFLGTAYGSHFLIFLDFRKGRKYAEKNS